MIVIGSFSSRNKRAKLVRKMLSATFSSRLISIHLSKMG